MANMSYCRFENTLHNLEDCFEHIHDKLENEYEIRSRPKLIQLCKDIAKEFSEDDEEQEDDEYSDR